MRVQLANASVILLQIAEKPGPTAHGQPQVPFLGV